MAERDKHNPLPNDPDELRKLVLSLSEQVDSLQSDKQQLQQKADQLQERVILLERYIYARKSEKLTPEDKRQMVLFDEADNGADSQEESAEEEDTDGDSVSKSPSKKRGRKPIPADIPRERVIHHLTTEEKTCPCCGKERPHLGYEVTEELFFKPAEVKVLVHEKEKCGPCSCEDSREMESSPVLTAKAPPRIMPGSIASASLLAFILTGKFCDSLPYYRHERIFRRIGIEISRTNMCNWTIKTASRCSDLIDLMRDKTREGPLINMDETTLQVLKETGKKVDSKSYMWVTVGTDFGNKIILYNYSRSRSAQMAETILDGFTGVLQTDGYAGYNSVVKENQLYHVGCLAHIRRKFFDAAKATKSGGQANKAMKYIKALYRIEKELRSQELPPVVFVSLRRQKAIPVLKDFRKWLKEKNTSIVPSSALGKAIGYALSEYVKMVRYLKHDFLTPDNNAAENAIRPFVVGRKNWLFNDTPKGAYASATIYSLVETAKANGLEPFFYLNYIFERLPEITKKKELESLLPWNIQKTDSPD